MNPEGLPLGILRQAVMKIDSFMADINEVAQSDGISAEDQETFVRLTEMAGHISATIINMVSREISEEEFLREEIDMDEIEPFPGVTDGSNLLDEPL